MVCFTFTADRTSYPYIFVLLWGGGGGGAGTSHVYEQTAMTEGEAGWVKGEPRGRYECCDIKLTLALRPDRRSRGTAPVILNLDTISR